MTTELNRATFTGWPKQATTLVRIWGTSMLAPYLYAPGRWAWCSSRIVALDPFPVQGHQGFMRVPRAAVRAMPKQCAT